jgi:HPt (histidine-containing phosphotransfer) domain-containing protein
MGKPDVLTRVLGRFEQTASQTADQLEAWLSAGDAEEVRRLAHSLKGAAANLSAEPLRAAAAEMERLAGAGADAAALTHFLRLRVELEKCLHCAAELISRAEGERTSPAAAG